MPKGNAELAQIDALRRQIEILGHATAEIRTCSDIGEVRKFADMASAVKTMAQRVKAGIDVQNAATAATSWARRREGELIRLMPKHPGGRPNGSINENHSQRESGFAALSELGIDRNESSRAQALAAIPEDVFEEAIESAAEQARELTTGELVRLGRNYQAVERGQAGSANGTARREEDDRAARGQKAWEDLMNGHFRIVNSIRKMGGVGVLVKGWKREDKEDFVGCFDQLIEELQALKNELRRQIDAGR